MLFYHERRADAGARATILPPAAAIIGREWPPRPSIPMLAAPAAGLLLAAARSVPSAVVADDVSATVPPPRATRPGGA